VSDNWINVLSKEKYYGMYLAGSFYAEHSEEKYANLFDGRKEDIFN